MASGGATRLSLVGRRSEFQRLTVALDGATSGRMRAVAVLGDPGIGKTRLVEELADVAGARGVAVAWGRATQQQGAPPYWVWRQVIDSLARTGKSPRDRWADSEFLRSGGPDRYAQLEALRDRLDRGAARDGLLVILDDAQWLDESSLWLLTEFVQLRDVDRMLLVLTARLPDTVGEQPSTATAVAGGDRFERVVLGPLPSEDIATQVRGLSDGSELDADILRAVVDRADGNPFFAAELCRAAATTLVAGRKPARNLPETVRDAVRQRLHGLSPSSVAALEAASVLGRSFLVGLLADILGATPLHTIEALEEAVGSAVLVRDERLGAYRFAHPLIPEAVVEGLDLSSRRRLHRAAMASIERVHAGELDDWVGELARHAAAAFEAGDLRPPVHWAVRASEVAMNASAWLDAVRLTQSALDLGHGSMEPELEGALLVQLAHAAFLSAEFATAADAVERAMRLARSIGSIGLVAHAALSIEPIGAADWDARACRWYEIALASGEFAPDVSAQLHARLAQSLVYAGDLDAADRASRQAIAESGRGHRGPGSIAAIQSRRLVCSAPEGSAERAGLAGDLIRTAVAAADTSSELSGRLGQLDCSFEAADLTAGASALRQAADLASRLPGPTPRWLVLRGRAVLMQARSRYSHALRLADEAHRSLETSGHPGADGALVSLRAGVGRHIGHDRAGTLAALEPYAYLAGQPDDDPAGFLLLARVLAAAVHAAVGQPDIAAHYLDSAGPMSGWRVAPYLRLEIWASAVGAVKSLGRRADLAIVYQRLRPYPGYYVASGGGTTSFLGPVTLHLGIAANALGRDEESVTWLDEACRSCSAAGLPGFLAESQLELGLALLRSPAPADVTRGRELLRSAAAGADRLGMTPLGERAGEALHGSALHGLARNAEPPLTDREGDVADLVAQGLTNRQIAERLVIAERTAQNHVQHILAKLGVSNRVQVAAWWRDRRPAGERHDDRK